MKYIYKLLIFNTLIFLTSFSQEKLQTVAADNLKIQYVGRFDFANPKQAKFAWTGAQITFTFEGTLCNLLMNNFSEGNDKTGNPKVNYFNVFINNKLVKILKVENGKSAYELAKDLPRGRYTVSIFRRTEASLGLCEFIGFQVDTNASILDSPARPTRKMEFIGDSITCGYGNEGDNAQCPFTPATENGYLSYAAITARNLSAEGVTICYSGKGLLKNYDKTSKGIMPVLYDSVYPQDSTNNWKSGNWTPNAIVINLGTNDFAHDVPDSTLFCLSYHALIGKLLKTNPQARIFCVAGTMMSGEKLATIKNYLQNIVDYQRKKGNTKVYFFEMSTQGKLGYGCDWHPNVRQNQQNAKELTDFVKEKMKW
jgi:lysophospholipase L1-like esterase